ncbi:MAG: TetR/AcrR family transcriptional regulator [Aquabacterium sp.]|uniref:TetR/AcrR family transcriptional regulator n=1 Tax=Aquabacterium sp. TaxID=1872578 RepID=UPI0025BBCE6D|nr:TetR/AcrR family transcriptional regulator [Aquabacterium sp.]MBI3382244.1 TetR/AcrR family transcriptional regulator [Aquabacterium sp.]
MTEPSGNADQARVDRRVLRTREALRNALLALLVERGWDDIDIQGLCERANIGRSTFYLHFPNKEALLKGSFGDLRSALREQAQSLGAAQAGSLAFVGALINHVHEQQQVFRAMLGRRSGHFVQDRFRELLVEMVSEERLLGDRRSWKTQASAHYLGGALFQLLVWWLESNRPQKPSEIEALFLGLSQPLFRP